MVWTQNVEEVHTMADEMEMYAAVLRVFKKSFTRQETMKTFKMYDCLEVWNKLKIILIASNTRQILWCP